MLAVSICTGRVDGTAQESTVEKDEGAPPPGFEIVHPGDRAIMVWVPPGTFTMGMNAAEATSIASSLGYSHYHAIAAEEWFPARLRFVSGYFVDKYEVTCGQWNRYTNETKYVSMLPKGPPSAPGGQIDRFPATSVTWAEAQQYANWFGKQLPTEAQWEKAARGTDGRWYPWGNEPPTAERGCFPLGDKPAAYAMPVGSFPAGASPYGCLDMAGNVYEWTSEWLEAYPNNPESKRMLSYTGHRCGALRGGSFYHAMHALGCAKRFGLEPGETYYHIGFRTVWEPPEGYFKSAQFKRDAGGLNDRYREIEGLRK